MLHGIFVQELSDLVVNARGKILAAIQSSGIKIKEGASDKTIISTVVENMNANPAFSRAIWALILADNGVQLGKEKSYSNFDFTGLGAITQGLGEITKGVTNVFSSKQQTKQEQEKTTQAVLAAITAKYNIPRGVDNTTAIVVASVLGIGLITVLGIAYMKKKNK